MFCERYAHGRKSLAFLQDYTRGRMTLCREAAQAAPGAVCLPTTRATIRICAMPGRSRDDRAGR